MTEPVIREYRREDVPGLIKLWSEVFGDPESLVEDFFKLLPGMGSGVLAEVGGELAGAAYMLRGMDLVKGGEVLPCGYIYAVATRARFRGHGIGAALTKAAEKAARQWRAKIICTLPAEPSLYNWYESLIGTKPILFRKSYELSCPAEAPACRQLSAAEYLFRREGLLSDRDRLSVSLQVMEFQRRLCLCYGGGLYVGEGFIGFGYMDEGRAIIKELVCHGEDTERAAAAIARAMGAGELSYYLPAESGEPYIAAKDIGLCTNCIWNVSFD